MKRFASLLLALAMVFAMSTTAFAATTTDGKITVKNTVKNTTYSIYRIFDLESFSGTNYSYKVSAKWENFFKAGAAGLDYVDNSNGYVTWKSGKTAADFAAAALAYATAEATKIAADATVVSGADDADVVFENLPLGYYLVDSSLGALCALTTTDKEVEIYEKNAASSLEKQVKEDSTDNWGKTNDADISQTVEFKATITVQGYTRDLVMHDKMDDGLTFQKVSKVTLNGSDVAGDGNYTVTAPGADGCTFDVAFSETFCKALKSGDVIVVYYEAKLNDNAVVAEPENNSAHLSYKDESGATHTTTPSTTTTYTWDMEVLKYANGDESSVLAGVKFVLLNSDKTKVATVDANGKLTGWETVPAAVDGVIPWPAASVLTTDANGKIEIDGLDADTYYLREIEALPGFNVLSEDQRIPITGKTGETYTTYVANINNQSGAELPSTGGMGTTLFYVLGGALVIGAAVLLVVKRRMNGAER